jgi:molybdopterin synthase catalytic subunit
MIRIRFFAAVRERLGIDELTVPRDDLSEPTVGAAVGWATERYPELERLLPHVRLALDHEFVDDTNKLLAEDSEIALIPPVSGGSGGSGESSDSGEPGDARDEQKASDETVQSADGRFAVTTSQLDPVRVVDLVRRNAAGAVITFEGTVRNHTADHDVDFLVYEAYPEMALKKLDEVGARAAQRWPAEIAVHHRYGRLELGETAVVIAVSTPHRAEGFDCAQWIIDTLKQEVPIWKKEVGPDGEEWVGFGP